MIPGLAEAVGKLQTVFVLLIVLVVVLVCLREIGKSKLLRRLRR